MNFDPIKDFLNNLVEKIGSKIKDSALFNTLLEKYEHLDRVHQQWIKNLTLSLLGLFVLALPFSIFISSTQTIKDFKNKKELVLKLVKLEPSSPLSGTLTPMELDQKLSSITDETAPDEISISPFSGVINLPKELANLRHTSKKIEIKGVNIQKVVTFGQKLETLSPSVRVVRLHIEEMKENNNYFKASYTLVHFHPPSSKIKPIKKRRKKKTV